MEDPSTVLGHYVAAQGSGLGRAVGSWSTPLFNAVIQDDLRALEQLVSSDARTGEAIVCAGRKQDPNSCSGRLLTLPSWGAAANPLQTMSTLSCAGEASLAAASRMLEPKATRISPRRGPRCKFRSALSCSSRLSMAPCAVPACCSLEELIRDKNLRMDRPPTT